MAEPPLCPYCGDPSERASGTDVYPNRPDLAEKIVFICRPCGAWTGCHPGTTRPLGRLANAELRAAKMAAHAAFDPLWKAKKKLTGCSKSKARGLGYRWLSEQLGIAAGHCHIGMMDVDECRRVVEICQAARGGSHASQ